MRVKFSSAAREDLVNILDYLYEKAGLKIAQIVNDEIERVVYEVIAENPEVGSLSLFGTENLRFFPAGKYKHYHIYYTVADDLIVIRVLYGKRDVQSILEQ